MLSPDDDEIIVSQNVSEIESVPDYNVETTSVTTSRTVTIRTVTTTRTEERDVTADTHFKPIATANGEVVRVRKDPLIYYIKLGSACW